MGFVTLGFITNNVEGYSGAILIMLSHGLSAAGLFFCVGYLYEQSHTRSILAFRGIAATTPVLASLIFFFICANISFPGTANFIGEQLVLIGLAKLDPALSFLPVMGVLLNGLSTFLFYIRLAFGEVTNETVFIRELQTHKFLLLIVLFFPIVIAGFFPNFLVNIISKI
jgi:NADH:ubiquinone oxidoreductase subunit 4 (subunit M)